MSYDDPAKAPTPVFLLIQDGVIVDRTIFISFLRTNKIAEYAGFKIAVGYIQNGKRWVAGLLADVAPLIGQHYWSLSSEDYDNVIIDGRDYKPVNFIMHYLRDYNGDGRLADPNDLPQTFRITAGITAHDRALNDVDPTPDPNILAM
jgi:hypothetical protein